MLSTSDLLAAFFVELRDERKRGGKQQQQIATSAGMSAARISQLTAKKGFRIDGAEALAKAFDYPDLAAAIAAARAWERSKGELAAINARDAAIERLRGLLDADVVATLNQMPEDASLSQLGWIERAVNEQKRKPLVRRVATAEAEEVKNPKIRKGRLARRPEQQGGQERSISTDKPKKPT